LYDPASSIGDGRPPEADEVFVRGHQGARLTVLTERVRFRSTRLVLGDRTVADVSGRLGAPAIIDGAVFGLLSECSSRVRRTPGR
jgi:hypothetical protein